MCFARSFQMVVVLESWLSSLQDTDYTPKEWMMNVFLTNMCIILVGRILLSILSIGKYLTHAHTRGWTHHLRKEGMSFDLKDHWLCRNHNAFCSFDGLFSPIISTEDHLYTRLFAVDEALCHPYLAPLHDINEEPVCPRPFSFDFEQPSFTEENIKELIWRESVKYNPDPTHWWLCNNPLYALT